MPLARGTAAVGYTTMLGLFWAAGMPISSVIPKDYQVCSPCELTWFWFTGTELPYKLQRSTMH
jgi:hypothetical protein